MSTLSPGTKTRVVRRKAATDWLCVPGRSEPLRSAGAPPGEAGAGEGDMGASRPDTAGGGRWNTRVRADAGFPLTQTPTLLL